MRAICHLLSLWAPLLTFQRNHRLQEGEKEGKEGRIVSSMSWLYYTFTGVGVNHLSITSGTWIVHLLTHIILRRKAEVKELSVWPSILQKEMEWLIKIYALGELSYLIPMRPRVWTAGCIRNSWRSGLTRRHLMNCCLHKLFMCCAVQVNQLKSFANLNLPHEVSFARR